MEQLGIMYRQLTSESGLSCSIDTLSSRDCGTLPSFFSLDFFAEKKIKQVEQMVWSIKAARDKYLKKHQEMNEKVDFKIQQIRFKAESRKQQLLNELKEIVSSEAVSLERQLKICEKAENWLESIKSGLLPFEENLQEACNAYLKEIGFISAPQISFDDIYVSELNYLENTEQMPCARVLENQQVEKLQPKFCIGSKGVKAGEFSHPWGVCTDATGRILVADRGNNRIQIFNEHGSFLLKFGKMGIGPGEFDSPVGIAVDKKCRIIVADKNNHRVQVFSFSGGFMFMFGRRGFKLGQLQYPWDVDTNSQCDIAVSDSKNYRVQLFSKNGVFMTEVRFEDTSRGPNQFFSPLGIAFKPDDTLLMTDIENCNIFKIDKNFYTATKMDNHLKFCAPQGIACNSLGQFMIADCSFNIIQVFDPQGNLERIFGGEFINPQGVCFHPSGSIIIADLGNNRIQVF